ncbi:hypothetical protein PsorP6_011205 [Peronosclerospora sorghi]|uniref:Uncharacterized protein n=1 Tax=Peronosclerospora sorghi TaxID=230839 RepID=A0ACC0VU40_9STRA|nr:hypothetical protein PsorP6_011205 [Peronosclerospora sorghi]
MRGFTGKVNVYIAPAGGGGARRVCWYVGTSDAQVEMAIRLQLSMENDTKFLLRDTDGDVVPVSATLPNGRHFILVIPEDLGIEGVRTIGNLNGNCNRTALTVHHDDELPIITQEQVTSISSPSLKRKRVEAEESVSSSLSASPLGQNNTSTVLATRRELSPPRSISTIIAQFVDTFTRPIANEDNVSFIPNAGRFALYALYCEVVRDVIYHPKREDVFYKLTSIHGKVDRQRVIRYYRCLAKNGAEFEYVQYKPQGKGVLLRKYRPVGSLDHLEDVVKSAPFISWLNLNPTNVVAMYVRFVNSFTPIVKGDYKAQTSKEEKPDEGVHL